MKIKFTKMTPKMREQYNREVAEQEAEAEAAMAAAITRVEASLAAAVAAGKVREWWSSFLLNVDDHVGPESYALSAEQALREVTRS